MQAATMGMITSLLHQRLHPTVGAQTVKELAYLGLEKHDEADDTHADQFVEDAAKEAHLKYLAHQQPDDDEHQDAHEDIDGA